MLTIRFEHNSQMTGPGEKHMALTHGANDSALPLQQRGAASDPDPKGSRNTASRC